MTHGLVAWLFLGKNGRWLKCGGCGLYILNGDLHGTDPSDDLYIACLSAQLLDDAATSEK